MRVAVVTTHPIQYQVPWLRKLAAQPGIELKVFFAMIPDAVEQGREFGVAFAWDLPLLEGYDYSVLRNVARNPSLTHFDGCDTPEIGAELRAGKFDAVIVNGWVVKTCLQALLACRLAGIPCVVRGEANGLRPRAAWKHLGHRMLLRQYQAYLAIGGNNRQYYLDRGVPEERIWLTPYCVDNERFASSAAQWAQQGRDSLCQHFGLDASRRTLMFSGKFVDKKRPGDIVQALRRLPEGERRQLQLLFVGDGPLKAELERDSQGLPVRFAGFLNQSRITAAYAVADCMILPSDNGETWGLVTNEAMACGVPAIVSDEVGCAVDLVTPGVTGDVFACGDAGQLAGLLVKYVGQPEAFARMGAAAQERVRVDYNFDRVVEGAMGALASVGKGS